MLLVRPVQLTDLGAMLELAKQAYPGMTTFPPDEDALGEKTSSSLKSMKKEVEKPGQETYMLVMEDTDSAEIVGTASIISQLGEHDQFYSYKLNKMTYSHKPLDKKVNVGSLLLSNHYEGFAEVATLYLDKRYRKNGNGKLLSRSRYLFMAQFRQRFPEQAMADLRGYYNEQGRSPFWDAIGRNFFDMEFSDADLYGALNGNQFIADLMPKQPIYINLLPKEAQDAIGRPNDQGKGALAMLEKEGFRWNGHVDIFDGSPSVDVFIDQLHTVRASEVLTVGKGVFPASADNAQYLVSNASLASFGACVSRVEKTENGSVILPEATMSALQVAPGHAVRTVAA